MSSRQEGATPVKGTAVDTKAMFQHVEEDDVVDSIKRRAEIEQNEGAYFPRVKLPNQVVMKRARRSLRRVEFPVGGLPGRK